MIEKPKFWSWTSLKVDQKNIYNDKFLHSNRIHIVPEIRILVNFNHNLISNILGKIFTAVLNNRFQLKRLTLEGHGPKIACLNLDPALDAELLSQALVMLEEFTFSSPTCHIHRPFSKAQLTAVFIAIEQTNNLKLKNFYLPNRDYSEVPPEVLAAALVKLENSNIFDRLSPDLVTYLFTRLAGSSVVNKKKLSLHRQDLSLVPTKTLVAGISGLERVQLAWTKLTTEQLTGIFTRLSALEDHKLKSLDLDDKNLSSVPTETLVAGISGLEEVKISWYRLNQEQLTGIYKMVADRRCSKLRQIYLLGYDHTSIPLDLRIRADQNQSVKILI